MSKKLTTEEFVQRARKVHGDKYDYSKVEYKHSQEKVCIICPQHGEFWQLPNNHLRGKGCPLCKSGTKRTTEWFIEKARSIHGDKYDYSKVNYVDAFTKVCIICPIHGEFWQNPSNHIHKTHPRGCPKCNSGVKLSLAEFIEKARRIHGDKYNYSKVDYINASTKVCIICPKHGEFWQTPASHLAGARCPKCWEEMKGKALFSNTEEFVEKARKIHGNKYDYSKVEYERSNKKVCIICPIHGEFWQTPSHHLRGQGCPKCGNEEISNKRTKSTEQFIKEARVIHGDKYDYSKVDMNNRDEKGRICIICPTHGEFWQTPSNHLHGKGCELCVRYIHDTDTFIEKAKEVHGDKYDYSKVNYINQNTKVCIICPKHGEFWQLPNNHVRFGYGCPKCNISHLEREIENLLSDNNIEHEWQKHFDWLGKQSLDFYLPKYNVAIECQGRQHFEDVEIFSENLETIQNRDKLKKQLCDENGIKLFYYSNFGKDYPYEVFEDKKELLKEVKKIG